MSTSANISVNIGKDKFMTIYLHSDGYPEHALEILRKYYNNTHRAVSLVAGGDLSRLSKFIESGNKGHSFDAPHDDVNIYYGRDRGESNTGFTIMNRPSMNEDHNYVFENNEWVEVARTS